MKQKYPKFVSAILIALVMLLNSINPLIANAATLKNVTPQEFVDLVYKNQNKYEVIFMFTSWCLFCKRYLPEMVKLQDDNIDKLSVTFLSLDQKLDNLSAFTEKLSNFPIDIYNLSTMDNIITVFNSLGVEYGGKVPHITLLDHNRGILLDGHYTIQTVKSKINELLEEDNKQPLIKN